MAVNDTEKKRPSPYAGLVVAITTAEVPRCRVKGGGIFLPIHEWLDFS